MGIKNGHMCAYTHLYTLITYIEQGPPVREDRNPGELWGWLWCDPLWAISLSNNSVSSHLRVTLKQLAIRSTLIDTSTISLSTGSKNTTVIILPLSSSFRLHPTATADVTLTNHLHIPRPVLSCSTHVQHMVYLLERYRSTTSSVHSSLLYL